LVRTGNGWQADSPILFCPNFWNFAVAQAT
jgi:hypothetical protein